MINKWFISICVYVLVDKVTLYRWKITSILCVIVEMHPKLDRALLLLRLVLNHLKGAGACGNVQANVQ